MNTALNAPLVHQDILLKQLKAIFPDEQSHVNAREVSSLKFKNAFLEADVWFPKLQLCFEFQDAHHYSTTWYNHLSQEKIQLTDSRKREIAQQNGITLIDVPCWWDGEISSLVSTIAYQRSDLPFEVREDAIPLNPPLNFFPEKKIQEIGELMLASFPIDPKISFTIADTNLWWMGEKYDGIRSCWIPGKRMIYTRSGRALQVIPQLTSDIPKTVLDFEFWFGRGLYADTFVLSQGSTDIVKWHFIRMISFDEASNEMRNSPFEARYKLLLESIPADHILVKVVPRMLVKSDTHLQFFLQSIIEDGGEGAILRRVGSIYEPGRSLMLVKLKKIYGDKEAIVVGKNSKEVILKMPNGITFPVPREDVLLLALPNVGDIVSFSAESFSRRMAPVSPRIFRIRTDLSWEDIVGNSWTDTSQITGFTSQPLKHWTAKNMRLFLENFAKIRNMDPLLAETWYNIPQEYIGRLKGGNVVLQKFGGHISALKYLFPEINFEVSGFLRSSWNEVENRRNFFEKFAKASGFDHKIPENWYFQPTEKIMATKGAPSVIMYHNGSVSQALLDLFPDIGLDKSKLWISLKDRRKFFENYARSRGFSPLNPDSWYLQSRANILSEARFMISAYYNGSVRKALMDVFPTIGFVKSKFWPKPLWHNVTNRRKFFENFAAENGFDPLVATNWYSQARDKIMAAKGAGGVMNYHANSVSQALIDLFPAIGLEKSKFWITAWRNSSSRRKFFEDYARANSFDPLNPDNWYSLPSEKIMSTKGAYAVLSYHKNMVPQALSDLFPDIGLEKTKFRPQSSWHEIRNRRKFFENYAKTNHFDPQIPENWYTQPTSKIMAEKGATRVMSYHNHSVPRALADLFPNIGIDKRKFAIQAAQWKEEKARRKFFEDYAKEKGFDPLNPLNWYSQPAEKIMEVKGAYRVISYHKNIVAQALVDLFPDIGLDLASFSAQPAWHQEKNRRLFFENYAKANGFDPQVAENWHTQDRARIMSLKGATRIIHYHNHSVSQALIDLFPNIGLKKSEFWKKGSWHDKKRRRKFFENFARENDFDPIIAENWYSQSIDKITEKKGSSSVLAHHNKSVSQALFDLFPEIGLDKSRLWPHKSWRSAAKRRQFFENFAKENEFSPNDPEVWYSQPLEKIMGHKGAYSVMYYHNNSAAQALCDLFPELRFSPEKFARKPLLHEIANRRKFFENFAKKNGFDPLSAEKWHVQSVEKMMNEKGMSRILSYHSNNVPKALSDLFPDIGIDPQRFSSLASWRSSRSRRKFFEKIAHERNFDASIPDNWYSQNFSEISSRKGAEAVMSYHKNSMARAMIDLFPDIGLDKSKLTSLWKKPKLVSQLP